MATPTHLQTVATWKPGGNALLKVYINPQASNKLFLVQWIGADSFIVRGRGLALNGDATLASGVVASDLATVEASDAYGTLTPSSWVIPTGYVAKQLTDGTTYYISAANAELDSDGNGIIDSYEGNEEGTTSRYANFLEDPLTWAKENPLYALIVGVIIYMVVVGLFVENKKKRAKLSLGLL